MLARFALVTDFGGSSPYIGQLKVVLGAMVPAIPVVELVSGLPPFKPELAAYLLPGLVRDLPSGTVYLCVVDPGVGTNRDGLVVKVGGNWFIGPDNGILSQVASRNNSVVIERIDWRPRRLSNSFHGRDLFAPTAVKIAKGESLSKSRVSFNEIVGSDWPDNLSKIVFVDTYGNLCTGISANTLPVEASVEVSGKRLRYARTFGEVGVGELFWYENSFGLVELSVNRGSAESVLGIAPGDYITIDTST